MSLFRYRRLLLCFVVTFLISFSHQVISQESTIDNIQGIWLDDASWSGGSDPGVTEIDTDVEIYGTISRFGDLDFNDGDLTVHDTLLIYGNLTLGNNADLTISDGGGVICKRELYLR